MHPLFKRLFSFNVLLCTFATPAVAEPALPEPNVEIASQWWPQLENVYSPIGWKNHLFRFNVFYNGMIMAKPQPETDVTALDPWTTY